MKLRHLAFLLCLLSLGLANLCFARDTITTATHGKKFFPVYPKPDYGTDSHRIMVERGEYLAKVGDCISCHTDSQHKGKPYAGGLGIKTPFGTFYTPNITPDKETGIGNWRVTDFIRALHDGVRPDGSNYFPVFPYTFFNKVSKQDLIALWTYLQSIPAVHRTNRKHDVPWPISWRFLQYGWRMLFYYPHTGEFKYDPDKSQLWNRGGYLLEGLGHCGACHTPRNILGARKLKYSLTGGMIQSYFAPDITSKGVISEASEEEIVAAFKKERLVGGPNKVIGPMLEVDHNSLENLTHKDLLAIAIYLKSLTAKEPDDGELEPGAAEVAGKKIYESYCVTCHGTGAAGAPKISSKQDWAPRIKQGIDVLVQTAIKGKGGMPPRGTCMNCSDGEIKAAVTYMVDKSQKAKPGVTPSVQPVKLTIADGKKIYEKSCAVCHTAGLLGSPKIGDKAVWAPLIKQGMDVLFTHSIYGVKGMPERGACNDCTDAELIAAIKYMVQESKTSGDYSLW